MRRFKLLVFLGLLAIPSVFLSGKTINQGFKNTSLMSCANTSSVSDAPKADHPFRVNGTYYDTLASAISGCPEYGTIQMLDNYSENHTRESDVDLPLVTINKSLTINGLDDSQIQHTIKGVRFKIEGASSGVNFSNVTIDGDKAYNKRVETSDVGAVLIDVINSTLNLSGNTIIKDYKYYSRRVISIAGSTLNIKDNSQITDCAAKYGIIRYDNYADARPSTINMSGGKIYNCLTSNMAGDPYHEGVLLYMSHGLDASSDMTAKFNMTGGEISNNKAICWSDKSNSVSPGLIYIRSKKVQINITGGSIKNNVTELGGAIYSHDDNSIAGNINIGGSAYVYDNKGREAGKEINSNVYCNTDPDKLKINVDKNTPLTKEAKAGIFLKSSLLPSDGQSRKVVNNATESDCSHFIADNADYTMKYNDSNKTIDIYKYKPDEPRFTPPTIVAKDTLTYTGEQQNLIVTPGSVVKDHGGDMMYSTDYNGSIEHAHWIKDSSKITGTDADNYKVTYYVTANDDVGTVASTPVTVTTNIKPLEITDNPFTLDQNTFAYDGHEHIPNIIDQKGLYIEGTDYDVTYPEDKVNAGTKTITITMKGNYYSKNPFKLTYTISPVQIDVSKITWPEDNFIHKEGTTQSITPTIVGIDGKEIKLDVHVYIEGDRSKEVDFNEPTADPNKRYEVVAYSKDPNYQIPETAVKYYTMRVSTEEFKENMEIENLPGTNKPVVKVESEIGFDSWTKLVAKKVDSDDEQEKQEYKETTEDLTKSNNLVGDDAISAVYDVKLLKDGVVIQPDGSLKVFFALPEGATVNQNISIYHIHENDDGSKEITEMNYEYTADGYASVVTDKLSAFVIVHHQISLMWLIITLSVSGGVLVAAITLITVKKGKKKSKR